MAQTAPTTAAMRTYYHLVGSDEEREQIERTLLANGKGHLVRA